MTSKPVNYRQYKPGQWEVVEGGVIVEKPVSLTVNTEVWMVFMCTPLDLEALALGFLFNENVIQSYDEVASIRVCPKKDNIDVWRSLVMPAAVISASILTPNGSHHPTLKKSYPKHFKRSSNRVCWH